MFVLTDTWTRNKGSQCWLGQEEEEEEDDAVW